MTVLPLIDGSQVVALPLWVIPFDSDYFGDKTDAWPAFDLNDDIQRICDVCLDGAIRYFNTAL